MIPTEILNYRIVRLIGTGGMGSVYLATNTNIDQQVAIKVLRPELAESPMLRARLKQEAEMLCALDHPGIVKFLNYVESPEGVYLIMEYVRGITLEDFIHNKNGLVVEKKAYPMITEMLDAFAYAHSKGIVHRDIKPSNIIIQEDGHIKVMDFGIAQIMSESRTLDSKYMVGTPTYMSPEQVYSKDVDERSDIYSIGVLIHHMLTGRAPYDSTLLTAQEIKRRVIHNQMPRMADYYPYISEGIQLVVDKATQKAPEDRYQTCLEMKEAVKKAISPDPMPKALKYGLAAAAVVIVAACLFAWDYYRTKVEYYRDYAEVYGIPEGVGSLSSREMSHRRASYRFEYSRHKLRRVSYVNSFGNVIGHTDLEDKDRIVDMTMSYTEGTDHVNTQKFMNQSGKVMYVKAYDENFKTCTFKLDDELGTEMTLSAQTRISESSFDITPDGKSKISKYILDYDDDGRLMKLEYAGFGNTRVPDGQGIFGKAFVYDDDGRVTEEHYLGKDGMPKATQYGLGIKKYEYDDDDNLARITYLTIDGKPSSDGSNCPVVAFEYDKWGNVVTEKYTDISGNPMVRNDKNCAGARYSYDDNGYCRKHQYLGIDNELTYVHGNCGMVMEYDENGYLAKRSFIDAKGKAAYETTGDEANGFSSYSKMVFENDAHGNVVDLKLLNSSDEMAQMVAYAHKKCTYDSIGNQLSEYYYNSEGHIYIPAQLGVAGYVITYNAQGRTESITTMDDRQRPMVHPEYHYSSTTFEYDERGNITKVSYLDNKNKPVITHKGIAYVTYEYDENGNETARQYLGTKGNPCVLNKYCSRVERSFDEQGNCVTERYKNTEGQYMTVNGAAGYNRKFDRRGNIIVERPINPNGGLADGMLEKRLQYDERDNVVGCAYFGPDGARAVCPDGYHKSLQKYNSNNICVQTEYYDTNNMLCNVGGHYYAVVKREYDDRGNLTSESFFTQTGARGYDLNQVHKYYNQYDKVANKIKHQISFGCDGKPIAVNGTAPEGRVEYDKRGNMTKIICYNGYGKKANGQRGWCETHFTYDESGMQTSMAYYTIDGKPALDSREHFHKLAMDYNGMRLLSRKAYYGPNGGPIAIADGTSIVKIKYNNQNQRTEVAYFGTDGRPVNRNGFYHREVYMFRDGTEYKYFLFDKDNRKIEEGTKVNNKWKAE